MPSDLPIDAARRGVLKGGGAAVAAAFGGPVAAFAARVARTGSCAAAAASALLDSPYGAVAPAGDLSTGLPLIELPPGFSYRSHGWRGDVMSDGLPTPARHDGMGVALQRRVGRSSELLLVRNHEQGGSANAADIIGSHRRSVARYDTGSTDGSFQSGGTTTLVWRDGTWADSWASFGGTRYNCAGGASTWGSWLTNEELLSNGVSSTGRRHGYAFEVPADTSLAAADPEPIVAMGRMAHEACAIDPATGIWYLTEDQANANTLYRFLPQNAQGGLRSLHAGGRLQGLRVKRVANADLRDPALCQEYDTAWVDIAAPDIDGATLASAVGDVGASGPYRQAYAGGAAIFGANEGCWVAGGTVFFSDKQVAAERAGRIWALDLQSGVLKAVFVSNDVQVGNSPDNLCVSPRGGVLFCEDGGDTGPNSGPAVARQRLMVLHAGGGSSVFATNNFDFTPAQLAAAGKSGAAAGDLRNTEWCGACFSPDGRVLFVNLQGPGLTLAISGPFERGTL